MADAYRLDRDKLQDEVWAESITKVSKRDEISNVALAKICRTMAIPLPERGNWVIVVTGRMQNPSLEHVTEVPQRGSGNRLPELIDWPGIWRYVYIVGFLFFVASLWTRTFTG